MGGREQTSTSRPASGGPPSRLLWLLAPVFALPPTPEEKSVKGWGATCNQSRLPRSPALAAARSEGDKTSAQTAKASPPAMPVTIRAGEQLGCKQPPSLGWRSHLLESGHVRTHSTRKRSHVSASNPVASLEHRDNPPLAVGLREPDERLSHPLVIPFIQPSSLKRVVCMRIKAG